jgi:metal-responsive CopG/Arc/MetJ family transcriptional regulator
MSELRVISIKIPEDVYQELALRVPEGERSNFIRDAIIEKLQKKRRNQTKFSNLNGDWKNLRMGSLK